VRLRRDGPNEPPRGDQRSLLRIVLDVFREPMFQLLIAAGFIYLTIGNLGEALMLLGFAIFNVAIAVYQESKTERVLEALCDLTSPRALVIRDGAHKRIPGREVVRGDAIVFVQGDRVPADAVVLSSSDLETDESLLTGESVPVRKVAWDGAALEARPGGDDLPFVYSGSMIVKGHGIGEVRAIGANTEIGRIGSTLRAVESEPTLLHRQTRRMVRAARRRRLFGHASRQPDGRLNNRAVLRRGIAESLPPQAPIRIGTRPLASRDFYGQSRAGHHE